MINIAICDDMELDRKQTERLIREYFTTFFHEIDVMTFTSGEGLAEFCMYESPGFDLIFLDIYMDGEDGIQTAQRIREEDLLVKIIFTTTSKDRALESFGVYPFNYLVKPIGREQIFEVLENALMTIDDKNQKSITVKVENQMQTIFFKDIKYLDSAGRKTNIHTKNTIITFYSKLDDIEMEINDKRFLRCHKSFLVNMDYIASVDNYSFILTDDSEVPIKQRAYTIVRKSYYSYIVGKTNLDNHNLT